MVSNRPDAGGLAIARAAGIATEIVDHTAFGKDRAAFERALQAALEKQRIDLVCLAGFMRLLTPGFVGQWRERMLNIHPALLPAFKGLDTHARALEAGAKVHGATRAFRGAGNGFRPIIAQGAVAVRGDDTRSNAGRARARGRAPHLSAGARAGGGRPRARRERPLPDRWRAGSGRRARLCPIPPDSISFRAATQRPFEYHRVARCCSAAIGRRHRSRRRRLHKGETPWLEVTRN